jgi:hypothetical protein
MCMHMVRMNASKGLMDCLALMQSMSCAVYLGVWVLGSIDFLCHFEVNMLRRNPMMVGSYVLVRYTFLYEAVYHCFACLIPSSCKSAHRHAFFD